MVLLLRQIHVHSAAVEDSSPYRRVMSAGKYDSGGIWQQTKCFERLFEAGMSIQCFCLFFINLQGDGKCIIFS